MAIFRSFAFKYSSVVYRSRLFSSMTDVSKIRTKPNIYNDFFVAISLDLSKFSSISWIFCVFNFAFIIFVAILFGSYFMGL